MHTKRDISLPKGREVKDSKIKYIKKLLGKLPIKRDMLIEALHLIQDQEGYLSKDNIVVLAEIFNISRVEVYEVASFYHHFVIINEGEKPPNKIKIRICSGLSCEIRQSSILKNLINEKFKDNFHIQSVPCIGNCDKAPAVQIGKRSIENADFNKIKNYTTGPFTPQIPKYETLDKYLKNGGYKILKKILNRKITSEEVIRVLSESKLSGLGGAGFSSGKKWEIVRSFDKPRLMTVNGDEGEPGTFKDRFWIENKPHQLFEGALIAANVVGCEKIYFYIRDEYPACIEILKRELDKLKKLNLVKVPIEIRRGAGAYICGEESAMIESIEGKRGIPRHRPPYIAEKGLFDKPTLNHNIETLIWIPEILEKGSEWFSSQGWTKLNHGLRSFSVSGRVKCPGVKIAPAGIPLEDLINRHCGGMQDGHKLMAFFPGGASGGIFPAKMAKKPMDFGVWEKDGGFIGSHAVVILSHKDNVLNAVKNTIDFFEHESCGQCTPCRVGLNKISHLLKQNSFDKKLYEDLNYVMRDSSICGLGQSAGNCINHFFKFFNKN
tara:strand:+ start:4985 stop:6634 length:1650 start_codon:yes stop_codon:yes gene_type:complete